MARSIAVSPAKLKAGEKYIQLNKDEDKGKCIKGEAEYRGYDEQQAGYLFEDKQGSIHILKERDLLANPMYQDTISTALMYQRQKENRIAEMGGINKHDPVTIIKAAHKEKYGVSPLVTSFGLVQEDAGTPLLGYKANINRQDYLLVMDKKENGKADYTNYVYGMLFSNDDYVKPEDLEEGKYYYVDNVYVQYKGMSHGVRVFQGRSAKSQYLNLNCTDNYINIYRNIQKTKRKEGSLEAATPLKEVKANAENEVKMQEFRKRQAKLTAEKRPAEVKVREMSSLAKEMFAQRTPYGKEDRLFIKYNIQDNVNRVSGNALVEGTEYLTPFGLMTYIGRMRKDGVEIVQLGKNGKTAPTGRRAAPVYVGMLRAGDLKTADSLKAGRVLYEFTGPNGKSSYFMYGDIVAGIITKPLVVGATYITPEGFAVYRGMNANPSILKDSMQEDIQAKVPMPKTPKELRELEAHAKDREGDYETLLRKVASLCPHMFTLEDGKTAGYGHANLVDGSIRPVTAQEKEQAIKEVQARVQKQQRQVNKRILEQQRNVTFEAVENINKVPANQLEIGALYTTPRGILKYTNKEKNQVTKKENYTFSDPGTGTPVLVMEYGDIVAGGVSKALNPGKVYTLDGTRVAYRMSVYDMQTGMLNYYLFTDQTGREYPVTYRAIQQGRLRPEGDQA